MVCYVDIPGKLFQLSAVFTLEILLDEKRISFTMEFQVLDMFTEKCFCVIKRTA